MLCWLGELQASLLTLPLLLLVFLLLSLCMNSERFNSSMHTHAGSLLLLPLTPAALLPDA
jgi:hypothetical protein